MDSSSDMYGVFSVTCGMGSKLVTVEWTKELNEAE